jgi:predicted TPR repeat methyltransferase
MSTAAALEWWQNSLAEAGVQGMDKLLAGNASWDEVEASGRSDFAHALEVTGLRTGGDRIAVDVGCGVGRMTAALAEHFGCVLGLDVASAHLAEARLRNRHERVLFEQIDGWTVRPRAISQADTVFSYEVFYYLAPKVLAGYFRDLHRLLKDGGEFVFQLNLEPMSWKTRGGYLVRDVLYACGITHWRDWPTGPGFRRYAYTREWVLAALASAGFERIQVTGTELRQMWFVAHKPAARPSLSESSVG